MNIVSRAICRVIAVLAVVVGILNLIDAIYASTATSAATENLSMSATIGESVTVELNSAAIELGINPTSKGTFVKTPNTSLVSVYTNSPSAFNINMSANSTKLTSGEGTGAPFIDSITENKTCGGTDDANCANFPAGRWGYSVDSGANYRPIPASNDSAIIYGPGAVNSSSVSIDKGGVGIPVIFGVKLDLTTPTGTYNGTLNFAVTAARPGDEIQQLEGIDPPT